MSAHTWQFHVTNQCITPATRVEIQIHDDEATVGMVKAELEAKTKIAAEDFTVHTNMRELEAEDQLLLQVFGKFHTNSCFLLMKRRADLEGDEFDEKFAKPRTTRRYDGPATVTTVAPRPLLNYRPISPANYYNRKSETGYTGLSNQGATCYMNSLIQSLYMTPEFRSAVYNWSFMENLTRKVEKLKVKTSADGNSDELAWLESSAELLSLWGRLEQEARVEIQQASAMAESAMPAQNGTETAPQVAAPASAAEEVPKAIPLTETEEDYESKFVKAAKAHNAALYPHAVAFEKWKKTAESRSIPFQLRQLFAKLQLSEERATSTKGLTKSFGWTASDAFTQHDVQELLRVLFDALEQAWEGTPQHSLINDLYQGSVLDYVKCSACGHKSARRDTYLDLQLTVKPFGATTAIKSIEEALEKYVQPEILDGDNQYFCEQCQAKRDATKGLEFSSFPYLLTLQLKRFDFDWELERRIKLNDRVSFPPVLNLNRFLPGGGLPAPGAAAPSLLRTWSDLHVPSHVTVRPATLQDLPEILNVVKAAFKDNSQAETLVVEGLARCLGSSQLISLVALDRGRIVAHVMLSPVSLIRNGSQVQITEGISPSVKSALSPTQQANVPKIMGLAPLAVLPALQHNGIGTHLARTALEMALSWGVKAVVVLGHVPFYTRLGFLRAATYGLTYCGREIDEFMALELSEGVLVRSRVEGSDVLYHLCFELAMAATAVLDQAKNSMEVDGLESQGGGNEVAMKELNAVKQDPLKVWSHSIETLIAASPPGPSDPEYSQLVSENPVEIALRDGPAAYELFAIFVHRGSAQGGHYFAYIKEFETQKWFEFNDSTVSEITRATMESSFGGDGQYSSTGTAYMLLYRQADPARNLAYPSKSSIPAEAIEAVHMEKKRKEAKEALKRIEAQKLSISVTYRGSRKEIRLHREQTILDALKMAVSAFQVTCPIEDCRFHTTSQFTRPDDPSVFVLDTPLSKFSRDTISAVQLQVRQPGKEFVPFDPRSMLFLVHVWDSKLNSWPAESYEVYLPTKPTLSHLREYVLREHGIPISEQIITRERNAAQPVECIDGDGDRSLATLSLWEKATLWVEPFSPSLIDANYQPSRRKRLVSTLTSSSYKPSSIVKPSYTSTATRTPVREEISSSGEVVITAFGDDVDASDEPETVANASANASAEPANNSGSDKTGPEDDGYEIFHDPRFIIRDGKRIIPRSEDAIRNIQNRLIVRFTKVDEGEVSHSLAVSKTDSVASLREKMANILKVDPHSFVILKFLSAAELNDAKASIDTFVYGSFVTFQLKKGTPSLRGESLIRFECFVLPVATSSASSVSSHQSTSNTASSPSSTINALSENAMETSETPSAVSTSSTSPSPSLADSEATYSEVTSPASDSPLTTTTTVSPVRTVAFEPFETFLCADRMTVREAKETLKQLGKIDASVPVERIRLRKYGYDGHGGAIVLDGQRLSYLGSRILVQILDQPEPKDSDYTKILILRQVFPERWEFGDAFEFAVPPNGTYADVRNYCETVSELSKAQCAVRPIYNIPQLAEIDKIDWLGYDSRLERPVALMMTDGDYIFFRDPKEQFKAITEEEKRKLAKYRPRSNYVSRPERALTIKVDDST
jgi:ubiquitin C-terminal hydrolase/predicted N-acetyltransferase YhbS